MLSPQAKSGGNTGAGSFSARAQAAAQNNANAAQQGNQSQGKTQGTQRQGKK